MLINLPFLLFALLLLWFPRQWMRLGAAVGSRRRKRSVAAIQREQEPWNRREGGSAVVGFRAEFGKVRNYVDLVRGAIGGLAVMGGLEIDSCLRLTADAAPAMLRGLLALKLGVLLVGLLLQTIRRENSRLLFFAPIFYLGGLSLALCGLKGALFAFAMIWAINPMLGNSQGFLFVYAVLMLVFGLLFLGTGNKLPIVALVYGLLPVLLSLMSQRPLVLPSRKGTRAHGAEP